jgi:hypothetical protein
MDSGELAARTGIPVCNIRSAGLAEFVDSSAALPDPGRCIKCGRPLVPDDSGAHKKFINRGASLFFCISCLSVYLGVSEELVREKIEYFRKTGCTLFS